MKYLASALLALLLLHSCAPTQSCITGVSDLPLKSTEFPGDGWAQAPLRANAQYMLHGANSEKEAREKMGDYYFVRWYDKAPTQRTELRMHYTQARTASALLTRRVLFKDARKREGKRLTEFFFAGPERVQNGDILTWRIELWQGGKLIDSRNSYLWK